MSIVFLCSFFYLPFKHKSVYNDIKLCHQVEVFTPEYLNANNKLHEAFLNLQYTVLTISKLKQINNKSFYRLLIVLSGDISLNPGPVCKHQILNTTEWDIFKTKGLYLMHLNIDSSLPKIDELRHMARLSNAAVIGICESKLDKAITNSEILIDNYDLLRCDRNRKGGGVACYIRNDLSYTQKSLFPNDIENVFFEIHLPKTKPITVGIVYRPPNQTNFIKTLNENFAKLDTINKETYILGDFNINLYDNGKYIICKNNTLMSRSVTNDARNYHQFCAMFGLKQTIKSPTRITCRNTSLIDHILASIPSRVSQHGVINVSVSDHQLIYCTRKINKIKTGGFHKHITFRSFKKYTVDAYKDALNKVNFPNYELFNDVNEAYSNFFQKIRIVVDSIAPYKTKRVKANTQK